MNDRVPDPIPADAAPPSLASRIVVAWRGRRAPARPSMPVMPPGDWRIPAAAAALIAAGPLFTIAGAGLLSAGERSAAAELEHGLAPRVAAANAAYHARAELGAPLRRPGVSATIEALARALPADVTLSRAGREMTGALLIEVATSDPDRLRAALRRSGDFAGLRDVGQRQGDGVMLVTLREAVP
jgi:hypothetical protein